METDLSTCSSRIQTHKNVGVWKYYGKAIPYLFENKFSHPSTHSLSDVFNCFLVTEISKRREDKYVFPEKNKQMQRRVGERVSEEYPFLSSKKAFETWCILSMRTLYSLVPPTINCNVREGKTCIDFQVNINLLHCSFYWF